MIRSVDVTLAGSHIVVVADDPTIGGVELLDRDRESLLVDQLPDCADRYDFTWSISNRRLPIYVCVRPCGAIETRPDPYGPFVEPPPGAFPCDPAAGLPPTAECAAPLRAIEERNQAIRDNCAGIANHQRRLRQDLDMALILHGLAVGRRRRRSQPQPFRTTRSRLNHYRFSLVTIASLATAEAVLLARRRDCLRRAQQCDRSRCHAARRE
jgi:hypothetical protein